MTAPLTPVEALQLVRCWWLGDFTWKQFGRIFLMLWGNNISVMCG